jgi:hypothetical protein
MPEIRVLSSEMLVRSAFAVGLALSPTAVGEAPITPERCATVYDQTQPDLTAIHPLLADSLTDYEKLDYGEIGVTPHIQILDGAGANNITDNESLAIYADDTAYACEWPDGNSLVISIVRFTRDESKANNGSVAKLDVRETGPIDYDISDQTIEDAKVQLGQDLRNPADSYQEDLANFLDAIKPQAPANNPVPNPAPNPNDVWPQPEYSQETPRKIDWAKVLKIGGIASLAVGLCVLGYRVKRTYDTNVFRREVEAEINEVIHGVLTLSDTDAGKIYATNNQLDLPIPNTTSAEDPGLKNLRGEWEDLSGLVDDLRAIGDQIKKSGSSWSTQTVQNLAALQANYREIVDKSLPKEQQEYLEARSAAINAIATVGDRATQVNTLLGQMETDIKNLAESGWDVATLQKEWAAFSKSDAGADSAMSKEHLIDASNKIDAFLPQLVDLSAQIQTAESTLAANQSRHQKRDDTLMQYTQTAETETALMVELNQRFHASCIEQIQPIKDAVASLTDDLHRKQAEISLRVDAKSFDDLRQTATLTSEYNAIEISLAAKRKELTNIVTKLESLVELLPATLADTRQSYQASRTDVHAWGTDIDDDLVTRIDTADQGFANIEAGLNESRPAYFAIENDLSETTSSVNTLLQRAQSQRDEANGLRSDITTGNTSVQSELSSLNSYVSGHRDASHISVNITARSFGTSGRRAELRQTLAAQQELRDEIAATLRKAKQAVAEAEAERRRQAEELARQERARQAAQAAEAARDAARQSASRNTGNVGGGSSHNTGNL